MPRSKRGPALFDLLDLDREEAEARLRVPEWWAGPMIDPELEVNADTAVTLAEEPPKKPVVKAAVPAEPKRESTKSSNEEERVPIFRFDGDRVRFSFSSIVAAGVVFVFLVVLLGLFEWGRQSGLADGKRLGFAQGRASYEADAMDEIQQARMQPASTHLVESLLRDAEKPGAGKLNEAPDPSGKSQPKWVRGFTYVVAQEFSAGSDGDAERARDFLLDHGVPTAVVALPTGGIQLITIQGYNHYDRSQKQLGEKLLEKVQGVGTMYYAEGGRYRFDGYFRTLKKNAW